MGKFSTTTSTTIINFIPEMRKIGGSKIQISVTQSKTNGKGF